MTLLLRMSFLAVMIGVEELEGSGGSGRECREGESGGRKWERVEEVVGRE